EVVPLWTKVVVNHVDYDRDSGAMSRIDESLQPVGASVARLRCVWMHSVVAPVAITGELRHRHQLDCRDAQVAEMGQLLGRRFERARRCEGADVELINDEIFERQSAPFAI